MICSKVWGSLDLVGTGLSNREDFSQAVIGLARAQPSLQATAPSALSSIGDFVSARRWPAREAVQSRRCA